MKNKGFTLLEILIVVVIIGILASLAIPRYEKTVEHSRGTEAIANLNILRGAELRFWGEYDEIATNFNDLDVENIQDNSSTYFTYSLDSYDNTTGNFTITATRQSVPPGIYEGDTITIDQDGNLDGTWPFVP